MCRIGIAVWVLLVIALAGLPVGVQAQSDDGLVAEWHFDEGAGSVLVDSSGNGNDGVIYGATWVEGKFGKALSFDGVDDYVDLSSIPSQTYPLTIEMWTKPDTTTPVGLFDSAPGQRYVIRNYLAGYIDWWNADPQVTLNLVADEWAHLVFIFWYDGNRHIDYYKNGVLQTSATGSTNFALAWTTFRLGNINSGTAGWYDGLIDEVHIYNRALSPEEIDSHYEQGPTALSLTKTAKPNSIKQGQTTTITLTVKNTGITEIKDIEIADTIPQDLTFIDGETSKTYTSLSPKDSRQFQYELQFDEAGTFNLAPATAIYADYEGNYKTVKSKPASIEVIPSLVSNSAQKPSARSDVNAQTASVHLHGEKTDVVMGEDILLKLAAVNLITKPTMHVQVIITPPSGMSVTSSEFVQSGAGLFTASYEIEPGVGRDIEVRMRSNQVGDFVVNGRIVYYFGDDMEHAEDHTLTLPIQVRAEAEPIDGSSESKESSTPGFAGMGAVIGLLLAYMRKRV